MNVPNQSVIQYQEYRVNARNNNALSVWYRLQRRGLRSVISSVLVALCKFCSKLTHWKLLLYDQVTEIL